MSKSLGICTKDSRLEKLNGLIALLCELAPDSPCLKEADYCYQPDELLGAPDESLATAYSLVSKLLQNSPRFEGLPILGIFEEELLEQCSYIVQAFHLDRWISAKGFSHCRFDSYSPWLDRLRQVRKVSGSDYELIANVPFLESSRKGRLARKLWEVCLTPSEFFRRTAPVWSRYVSGFRLRRQARSASRGGAWFYSTAYTYTKIGLEYAPYLSQKLNFLVEDSVTGGKRLRELGQDYSLLYAWAQAADIPSRSQSHALAGKITSALASAPLSGLEAGLRSVLLNSDWYHHLLTRRLPFLMFNVSTVKRWFQSVSPEMILVGNAVWERALLQCEGAETLPRIMLQHGIMHWVYSVTDQPVDVFLLRGPFFQRVVNDALRRKTVICNFPKLSSPTARKDKAIPRDILFITAPYNVAPSFHTGDLRDILRSLLRVSHSSGRRLIIRVHPMEKASSYQQQIADLQHELGVFSEVVYSQGPGAEQVLADSCVAVLFFSTMFLDCLRHGIPIVSFGWHWFPYKTEFEKAQIFNFATDLQHFEELVTRGIDGSIPFRTSGIDEFLAPTEPKAITEFFHKISNSRTEVAESSFHSIA